jgi:AcrR family transcriptional regulator
MKSQRIDIASIRRDQIVEAAVSVITEQGLQNLSLSEIEKKAGMSRGQLTYYFPAKEDILLAVFDRLVLLTYQRIGTPQGQADGENPSGWDWAKHLLETLPGRAVSPEFECLQYTFLSQIGHREDFRQRLASLYENWRNNMARGLAGDMDQRPALRSVSPRALSTLVQALLHGLAMQRAADPDAFDPAEMTELCLEVLGTYMWGVSHINGNGKATVKKSAGRAIPKRTRRRVGETLTKGGNGERVQ